jgi:hypothetical protein
MEVEGGGGTLSAGAAIRQGVSNRNENKLNGSAGFDRFPALEISQPDGITTWIQTDSEH